MRASNERSTVMSLSGVSGGISSGVISGVGSGVSGGTKGGVSGGTKGGVSGVGTSARSKKSRGSLPRDTGV
jgi:hypothetical protein